ncbi:MAG: hypothetical protein ACRERD_12460 [Candidatus Binatia bacterium]
MREFRHEQRPVLLLLIVKSIRRDLQQKVSDRDHFEIVAAEEKDERIAGRRHYFFTGVSYCSR